MTKKEDGKIPEQYREMGKNFGKMGGRPKGSGNKHHECRCADCRSKSVKLQGPPEVKK